MFLNERKVGYVDAPQGLGSGLYAPLAPFITPLFAKPCTVFQISLCLFSLTSIVCNCANFNRLMHMQVQPL